MNLSCDDMCEHNICSRFCSTCQVEPLKFLGRDIQQVIRSKLPHTTHLKGYKIFVENYERVPYLCKEIDNAIGELDCLYEFYIQASDEALLGFYFGIWGFCSTMLREETPNLFSRLKYELNQYTDDEVEIMKSFGKYVVETFNSDQYYTKYYVNHPEQFAAGFHMGASFSHVDSHFFQHESDRVWIGNDLVKPDFQCIDLCIRKTKFSDS